MIRTLYRGVSCVRQAGSTLYWRYVLAEFGEGARIYPSVKIYRGSQVHIGAHVTLNDFVHIWGDAGVHIGADTMVAAGSIISSQSHDPQAAKNGQLFRHTTANAPVHIGKNVWVGAGAIILPGVTIGDGSIIAAGALCREDVPPGTTVAGVPAKPVAQA